MIMYFVLSFISVHQQDSCKGG